MHKLSEDKKELLEKLVEDTLEYVSIDSIHYEIQNIMDDELDSNNQQPVYNKENQYFISIGTNKFEKLFNTRILKEIELGLDNYVLLLDGTFLVGNWNLEDSMIKLIWKSIKNFIDDTSPYKNYLRDLSKDLENFVKEEKVQRGF